MGHGIYETFMDRQQLMNYARTQMKVLCDLFITGQIQVLPYYCLIDINNILCLMYCCIQHFETDTKQDLQQMINRSFTMIYNVLNRHYYDNIQRDKFYYLPYLFGYDHLVLSKSVIFSPIFSFKTSVESNTQCKLSLKLRGKKSKVVAFSSEEISKQLMLIYNDPKNLADHMKRLSQMSMVNEGCQYVIGESGINEPEKNFFSSFYMSVTTNNLMITSNPHLKLEDCPRVVYMNVGFNKNVIAYPKIVATSRETLMNRFSFMGGIFEPNKLDLANYFKNVTPTYHTINFDTYRGLANYDCKQVIQTSVVELCKSVITTIGKESNQTPCALKYYNGRWGLGVTFAIVPSVQEWSTHGANYDIEKPGRFDFFVNNVSAFLGECLCLIWFGKNRVDAEAMLGQMMKSKSGLNRCGTIIQQLRDDIDDVLQGEELQLSHAVDHSLTSIENIIRSLNEIKVLILELVISEECEAYREKCFSPEEFNEEIRQRLDEKNMTCWQMTQKSTYINMLKDSVIKTNTIYGEQQCLQYFHFKSRMFPIFKITGNSLTMFLPPYVMNEWMFPFDIDSLFMQHMDKQGVCYEISDRRLVANKMMSDEYMSTISYDMSPVGMGFQCKCTKKFFDQQNHIEQFMSNCIKGYIAMSKATGKRLYNGIYLTTFDVIISKDANNKFKLVDINNGGNYSIPQPTTLYQKLEMTDELMLIIDPNKLYPIPLDASLCLCPDINIMYGYRTTIQ